MGALISFLTSFFSGLLSWLFSTVIIKFLIFGAVFLMVTEVIPLIINIFLPSDMGDISSLISGVPSEVGYFLAPFQIGMGIKAMLSAYLARFIIRRLPFVG